MEVLRQLHCGLCKREHLRAVQNLRRIVREISRHNSPVGRGKCCLDENDAVCVRSETERAVGVTIIRLCKTVRNTVILAGQLPAIIVSGFR